MRKETHSIDNFSKFKIQERMEYILSMSETVILTTSFGIESAVMLDLWSNNTEQLSVIFIDTGQLWAETYQYAKELMALYDDIHFIVYSPKMTIARLKALFGRQWENGETGRLFWLEKTKMEPMRKAIKELYVGTWVSGIRKEHNEEREDHHFIEWSHKWNCWKVNPILDWSDDMIETYFQEHNLLRHPLSNKYKRVGDYWDNVETHIECGLHLEAHNYEI